MRLPRSSGILLHPTSLPGSHGIGDLGPVAYQFVDFLVAAGQRLWQILPLGPTGYGDSPYQCLSAFAGNPRMISLDQLVADGLLDKGTVDAAMEEHAHEFAADKVNYDAVLAMKMPLLRQSYERFQQGVSQHTAACATFCADHAEWLDDYALFIAIKEHHDGAGWDTWDANIAMRKSSALKQWRQELAAEIEMQKYLQYLFFSQWMPLKAYANKHDIRIVGDAPIFVAYDSADVWANPDLFHLDKAGRPTVIAGVPPDYFSETGQLWGNPLYRWDTMAKKKYSWWVARVKVTLEQVDILRLDHFRGFEAYWEVPAADETAVNGRWVQGPGAALFKQLDTSLGELPLIAEDLGLITPEVDQLRSAFGLPGMKVLQFAFGEDAENPYLPHNYEGNFVVYTGTHDNDTTVGWFNGVDAATREAVQRYLGRDGDDIAWDLIRLALMSTADIAVVPLQDVLRLGSEARMNTPGRAEGNWSWRFRTDALHEGLAQGLRSMTKTYGRGVSEAKTDEAEPNKADAE